MRVLVLATKPPDPPLDGGQAALGATLRALHASGVDITLLAPARILGSSMTKSTNCELIHTHQHGWWRAIARSIVSGRPLTIERHASASIADRAGELARAQRFDVVHVEQVQAFTHARLASPLAGACVLRAQNVESDVWRVARRGPLAPVFRTEARRLARYEASVLRAVDAAIALSTGDAARLAGLAPDAHITVVPPPVACDGTSGPDLAGDPALTWIGSAGWPPNDDALAWLMGAIWPRIAATLPGARLHVFGRGRLGATHLDRTRIAVHEAPIDSRAAFGANAICLLPLRLPAGVRMRILEAWARGVPVIATPEAAEGLDAADGRNVLLARDAAGFAAAVAELAGSPPLRARLVDGGRAALSQRHDPTAIAAATIAVYEDAIGRRRTRVQTMP